MDKKLSFSIDNLEVVDYEGDSQFATLVVDAFSSGLNRHELTISEETLRKTASTILQKPLVWIYDKTTHDAGTHDPLEVPCGFVVHDSPLEFLNLPDGRVMLRVIAKIWKRYSGELLNIFKRDKEKAVSVEIEVLDYLEKEILDFEYYCITVLGLGVSPAIPGAKADMVSFAKKEKKEYLEALQEFSSRYKSVDLSIPKKIKANAKRGLDLYKTHGKGGTSVSLASARFLVANDNITPEKIRKIYQYLKNHDEDGLNDTEPPVPSFITNMLWGGRDGLRWSKKIVDILEELDSRRISYFSEEESDKKMGSEAPKEEGNMEDEKKVELAVEEEKKEEAKLDEPEAEKMAAKEPEKEEAPKEDEKKEDEKKEDVKMSLDSNLDIAAILAMLEEETEGYKALVQSHSDGTMNYGTLCSAMYSKMCKMSEMEKKFKADNESYMAENENLKKFKTDIYAEKFAYEVEQTLLDVSNVMPKIEIDNAREESLKYTAETIDAWKNLVRAKAFTFSKLENKGEKINTIGLPFSKKEERKSSSPWVR